MQPPLNDVELMALQDLCLGELVIYCRDQAPSCIALLRLNALQQQQQQQPQQLPAYLNYVCKFSDDEAEAATPVTHTHITVSVDQSRRV